eukprot:Hpha_TRINITY_DN16311_c1_g5::TRINITY_DN16311_c1_g5_i1::g.62253::m.62253
MGARGKGGGKGAQAHGGMQGSAPSSGSRPRSAAPLNQINDLCRRRVIARRSRNYSEADSIQAELREMGISVNDGDQVWTDLWGRHGSFRDTPAATTGSSSTGASGYPRMPDRPVSGGKGGSRGGGSSAPPRAAAPASRGGGGGGYQRTASQAGLHNPPHARARHGGGQVDRVVGAVLTKASLEQYRETFAREGLDRIEFLKSSSEDDLMHVGVLRFHAKRILDIAKRVRPSD